MTKAFKFKGLLTGILLLAFIAGFNILAFSQDQKVAMVIHGGAGTILKENMTEEKELAIREKLKEALNAGHKVLIEGGTSIDAVASAIMVLENSPLFNAGKGAVFTNAERNELDASIMDGSTLEAGAVAGVTTIKNPILAAIAVMKESPHVMMSGPGAEQFASELDIETVDPSYFSTPDRLEQLKRIKERENLNPRGMSNPLENDYKFGTVGAVALDKNGNLAAGTSTGGMTNKRYGRIGDSPVIGAGTYADNETCGVSATGHGEYFIRAVVAYDIAALMKYKNWSLEKASHYVIDEKLPAMGGGGGIISMDSDGNISMPFNTKGMYRGFVRDDGIPQVFIYQDE